MEKKGKPYKIGLIVRDKKELTDHNYAKARKLTPGDIQKIKDDGLLFDETDIKCAYKRFQSLLVSKGFSNATDIIEWMNSEYLGVRREHLRLRLHQAMTREKMRRNISSGHRRHIISHKPRSGKSLTMLCVAKDLLEAGHTRILIATPVPVTIEQFIAELDKYIEFKDILFKSRSTFDFCILEDTCDAISYTRGRCC